MRDFLSKMEIPYEVRALSAHELQRNWKLLWRNVMRKLMFTLRRQVKRHICRAMAAKTCKPVIGILIKSSALKEWMLSLYCSNAAGSTCGNGCH